MRLIDADELQKVIHCEYSDDLGILEKIDNAPTVVPEDFMNPYEEGYEKAKKDFERPTGEWINHFDDLFPEESTEECSICHQEQSIGNDDNYCPNCGAYMKGAEE